MKRVRVCKEMAFWQVGEIYELDDMGRIYVKYGFRDVRIHADSIERMIKDGWLSWVEEDKSLEARIYDWYSKKQNEEGWHEVKDESMELAQIARDHSVAVFDKELKRISDERGTLSEGDITRCLRKALSQM